MGPLLLGGAAVKRKDAIVMSLPSIKALPSRLLINTHNKEESKEPLLLRVDRRTTLGSNEMRERERERPHPLPCGTVISKKRL